MPITIITERDNSVELYRACYHDCSLGELQYRLAQKIEAVFIARAREKKERVNWHDLSQAALEELESEGIIKPHVPWQKIGSDTLFSPNFIQAMRDYNRDPKLFHLTTMVPEKPDEPE